MTLTKSKIQLTRENIISIIDEYNSLYDYLKEMNEKGFGYRLEEVTNVAHFQLMYKEYIGKNAYVNEILKDCSTHKFTKFRRESGLTGLVGTMSLMDKLSLFDYDLEAKIESILSDDEQELEYGSIFTLNDFTEKAKSEESISVLELEKIFVSFQEKMLNKSIENSFEGIISKAHLSSVKQLFNEIIEETELEEVLSEREKHLKNSFDYSALQFVIKVNPALNDVIWGQAETDIYEQIEEQLRMIFSTYQLSAMHFDFMCKDIKEFIEKGTYEEHKQCVFEFPSSAICNYQNFIDGTIAISINDLFSYDDKEEHGDEEWFDISVCSNIKYGERFARRYNQEDLQEIRECFEGDDSISQEEVEELMNSYKNVTV